MDQFLWRWTASTTTREKVPKERASQNPKVKDGGTLTAMVCLDEDVEVEAKDVATNEKEKANKRASRKASPKTMERKVAEKEKQLTPSNADCAWSMATGVENALIK